MRFTRLLVTAFALIAFAALPASAGAAFTKITLAKKLKCTLPMFPGVQQPTDAYDSHESWRSCIAVRTSISGTPAVGQTATVTVKVEADQGVSGYADTRVDLPKGLAFVSTPTGYKSITVYSSRTDGTVGSRREGRVLLSSGRETTFTFKVRVTSAGAGAIRVVVTDPSYSSGGGQGNVYLTYGPTPQSSNLGITLPQVISSAAIPSTANPVGYRAALQVRPAVLELTNLQRRSMARRGKAAATTCATGSFNYQDADGTWHPSPNMAVYAWDEDDTSADDLLANGVTASDGSYRLCFNNDSDTVGAGTADVYIRFEARVNQWEVVNSDSNPYAWKTSTVNNIGSGDRSFGNLTTGNANSMRALRLYDTINRAFWAISGCWDQRNTCERKTAKWWPDYSVWPYASGNTFNNPGPAPDSPAVVLHELGHTIMHDAYEHYRPPGDCPSPHYINSNENAGCAWREGWPNWFAGHVMQNGQMAYWSAPDDNNLLGSTPDNNDLENLTWFYSGGGFPYDRGDTVEGAIAAALWDIEDSANEDYWDRTSEGFSRLWSTFQDHNSDHFADYWSDRASDGYDTTSTNILSTLYQNTIDIGGGFRDDMVTGTTYTRSAPPAYPSVPQNSSNGHAWKASLGQVCKVITVTPSKNTVNMRLRVYSNSSLTTLLVDSGTGVGPRTVTVPAGVSPLSSIYPYVTQSTSTSGYTYTVKATNCTVFSPGKLMLNAAIRSSLFELTASSGKSYTITATPKARGSIRGTGDAVIKVIRIVSNPNGGSTTETVATANSRGAGGIETLRVASNLLTPGSKYQVVIESLSGTGDFELDFAQS